MNKTKEQFKRHPVRTIAKIVFGILLGIWIAMTVRGA